MNLRESLAYLDSLANLEKIRLLAGNRSLNLDRMRFLLALFGHPEKSIYPVLIVGTKGKGSTGFFLQSILKEAGIPAGFYHSPHLESPLERIRLNGKQISEKLWIKILNRIRETLKKEPLPGKLGAVTYFEVLTLAALLSFQDQKVKIGVLEAGLGGRLDAVNALDAGLVLVTTIGLDHEEFLGNTAVKIAGEKAGVFRKDTVIFSAPQNTSVRRVLSARAKTLGARITEVAPQKRYSLGLQGDFQKINSAIALSSVKHLENICGAKIREDAIRKGLRSTAWPGRVEVFAGKPEVVIDGAHNPDSAEALTRTLMKFKPKHSCLVFGVSREKNSRAMLQSFSRFCGDIVLTKARAARAKDLAELLVEAQPFFKRIFPVSDSLKALDLAREIAGAAGRVVVTGSFYLAGEARAQLREGR